MKAHERLTCFRCFGENAENIYSDFLSRHHTATRDWTSSLHLTLLQLANNPYRLRGTFLWPLRYGDHEMLIRGTDKQRSPVGLVCEGSGADIRNPDLNRLQAARRRSRARGARALSRTLAHLVAGGGPSIQPTVRINV